MKNSRFDRALDYFPLLAYFGFWFQGAALGALLTRDPRLIAFGLITLPALIALTAAAVKIRRRPSEG